MAIDCCCVKGGEASLKSAGIGLALAALMIALGLASCSKSPGGGNGGGFPTAQQIATFGSVPRWSPDGQKLAFGGDGAQAGIWVYDATNGSLLQVANADYPHLYDYRWSNGNDKIAFGGAGASIENTAGIFVVGLGGANPVHWHATGQSPCWMPGDSGLVFAENNPQTGTYGLFKLDFSDTSLTQLTFSGLDPQYNSPGTQIAYREPTEGEVAAFRLRVMTASGSTSSILADTCTHFNWTEGGASIVFDYGTQNPNSGYTDMWIARVPALGGVVTHIVSSAIESSVSDAGRIAYQGINGDLSSGIYAINLDGGDLQPISGDGYQPAISPGGSAIAFARNDGIWVVNP